MIERYQREDHLNTIYSRLLRAQEVKRRHERARSKVQIPSNNIDGSIDILPASVARTETIIVPEKIMYLEQIIGVSREMIFLHGIHGKELPTYDEKVFHSIRTKEEMEDYYELPGEPPFTEIIAEKQEFSRNSSTFPMDYRLSLFVEEPDRTITIDLGFHNDFSLFVEFIDQQSKNTSALYTFEKRRPLADMADEEYEIMCSYIEQMLQQQTKKLLKRE